MQNNLRWANSRLATVLLLGMTHLGLCDKFISRQLNQEEIQDALHLADSVRPELAKLGTRSALTLPVALTSHEKWYSPVDVTKPRFNAIAQLIIVPFKGKKVETETVTAADGKLVEHTTITFTYVTRTGVKGFYCTAFYVAPDIIASAAHCFKETNVTPDSKHVIIVRQQSDGSKEFTSALAPKFERVVIEWIYPAEYDQIPAGKAWHKLSGSDYLFARVNAENEGKVFYKLTSPNDLNGKPNPALVMVGYSTDAEVFGTALSVSCKLAKVRDDLAKEDPGVREALKGRDAGDIQFNQLLCLGKGNMQNGGSGGPWLLDEASMAGDTEKADKERWVIGLTGWSIERGEIKLKRGSAGFKAAFMAEQAFCTATSSAWIKALHIKQLEALKNAPTTTTWKKVLNEL